MLKKWLLSFVLVLLTAAPAWAIFGDVSGVAAYDPGCVNCGPGHWQIVSVDPINQYEFAVYMMATFPNGDLFVIGPIIVAF